MVLRQDALERRYVGQYVIWLRHIRAKGQVPPIDPSNRQSQWLRSYKVCELRLTRVQDFARWHARMGE